MSTQRILQDKDFGRIVIRTRSTSRNISMRVKKDGLYVTVPPYSKTDRIMQVLDEYRSRLLESYNKIAAKPIDTSFRIDAPCFKLTVHTGNINCFAVRREEEGVMKIICPADTDFSRQDVQKLLQAAIVRALKKSAASFLPPLLSFWSEKYGLKFKGLSITGAKTRWGSCSSRGKISLSCYLMLLPVHLMDYVILHELAHTREMNHGPQFWELLNNMTDGNALLLRSQLRKFTTVF